MQRLFLAGRSGQTCLLGGGLGSALRAKIGSSVGVKLYQKRTFREIAARKRRFFFGCAERKPNVLGGRNSLGSRRLRLFGF